MCWWQWWAWRVGERLPGEVTGEEGSWQVGFMLMSANDGLDNSVQKIHIVSKGDKAGGELGQQIGEVGGGGERERWVEAAAQAGGGG